MKIPPVKGTRDFYPPDMAIRNFIVDGWKEISLRNGFEEYDGPIFEYLKMYQLKSGDEIAEQLFSLTDRGGRELAIRPEITPTLARMVNQQINSLPKPIKWFSVPRLCRAERPQKGRLREFFQWNIDIIGVDDVLADAEVIFTMIDYLRSVGLTEKDIVVKISSRRLLAAVLKQLGVPAKNLDSLYAVLDKKSKLPAQTFEKMLSEQVSNREKVSRILDFMSTDSMPQLGEMIKAGSDEFIAYNEIKMVLGILNNMGVGDFCTYDSSIVRGLAYYTGIVFEVYDKAGQLRAIGGGGRFDDLLKQFGGPALPATGMGMGDCILEILLKEKGLLGKQLTGMKLDYFVFCIDKGSITNAVKLVTELRSLGFAAEFSYKSAGIGKQLKQSSAQRADKCIILGERFFKNNKLEVKDMATGRQQLIDKDQFLLQLQNKSK